MSITGTKPAIKTISCVLNHNVFNVFDPMELYTVMHLSQAVVVGGSPPKAPTNSPHFTLTLARRVLPRITRGTHMMGDWGLKLLSLCVGGDGRAPFRNRRATRH